MVMKLIHEIFFNWMNGMEQFFEQANFADNKKVRYAKQKLRGKALRFWENLEYFRYMRYEPTISVWEDMKEKFCDEYLSPYYQVEDQSKRRLMAVVACGATVVKGFNQI